MSSTAVWNTEYCIYLHMANNYTCFIPKHQLILIVTSLQNHPVGICWLILVELNDWPSSPRNISGLHRTGGVSRLRSRWRSQVPQVRSLVCQSLGIGLAPWRGEGRSGTAQLIIPLDQISVHPHPVS